MQREDTRNTLFRTPARNISFAQEENFNPVKRVAPNPNNLSIGPPTCLVSNIGEPFAGDPFCAKLIDWLNAKAAAVEKVFSFNALERDRQELEQAAILTPASPEATDAKTETKRKNVWVLTSANVM